VLLRFSDIFRTVDGVTFMLKTCTRSHTVGFTRTPGEHKLLLTKYVFIWFRELHSVVFNDFVLLNSVHEFIILKGLKRCQDRKWAHFWQSGCQLGPIHIDSWVYGYYLRIV